MNAEPREVTDIVSDHQLFCARFSPCGSFLFAGSMDGGVRRWKLIRKPVEAAPEPSSGAASAVSPATPEVAKKQPAPKTPVKPPSPWELKALAPLDGFKGWVQTLAFHPEAKRVFSADSWGNLACFEYGEEEVQKIWEKPAAHDGWIRRVSVSTDGALLASCGRDGWVRVWSSVDGSQVSAFEAGADVFAVSFTPDGAQLVFGDMFGKLPVLDFRAGRVVRSLDGAALHKLDRLQDVVGLRGLAFSKDGKKLIAAGLLPKNGGTVQGNPMLLYFDFASGVLEQSFTHGEPKDGHIEDVALTADGNVIAVASGTPGNGLLFIHRQGEKTPSFVSTKLANCLSIALHPGERQFVVTSTNKASSGNGRRLTKEGEYLGNNSPVHLFEFPV